MINERKPLVSFKDYSFQYFAQAEPTLHDINLTIYEGEKVMIVGASGSGKSTLGNCINGLIPFSYKGESKGSVQVGGRETSEMSLFELSKIVGTVLQDPDGQFVGLSVAEDIAFSLENQCMPQKEMIELVQETAAIVDMDRHLTKSPFELSGGQKQRVGLAGVMVDDVELFLFDEPLANLDPATGKTAIDLIDKIKTKYNKTVVIIEHRLEDVLYRHVDRVIVMNEGRIVADMDANTLFEARVLPPLGIREPLYVSALRYAGVEITADMKPESVETLDIPRIRDAVIAWNERQPQPQPSPKREEILSGKDIRFAYNRDHEILKGIDFSISAGEMVSVVGTNGAGKSTLAKAVCALVKNVKGQFFYEGRDISDQTIKERAQHIGYVMQNPNQMICKQMIYDEVAMGLQLRKYPEEEVDRRVLAALKTCGLYEMRNWPISALSFGQKKRVTIASMLALEPKILILDEPTAGQDYYHYTEIMEFLRSLNESGVTILIITHDMHLMLEYTERTLVICDGKVLFDGSSVHALTNPDIAERANLKLTSLYDLAMKCGIDDAQSFVENFIHYERGLRDRIGPQTK
ncbi:MAG: ABC transporter ATP-binding protein [Lachnospiraceae bacterium]|nr:ABC transporter ATP-binding protein [Lachnospiraceae bacterium]